MPEAYNSIHTGEQIDEGIAVILNNDIPGIVAESKRLAAESKKSSEDSALSATQSANSASQSATSATTSENFSKTSESFAKGGTGTRPGEDTDNAKYYSELAAGSAGGVVGAMTFNGRSGNVLPEKGDYGVAQGVPILDETNKVPKELLPELGTNIPRSPTPPTDPETKLYIDTSVQNDSFYTAKEIDSKFSSLTISNPNLIVNSWFQVLQIKKVYNEIADRWFGGLKDAPQNTTGVLVENGIVLNRPQIKEYILTEVLIPRPRNNESFLTVSAQHTQFYTSEIKTSVFSFPYSTAPTFTVRSPIINGIQFQVRKEPYQYLDPTGSKLQYDKYFVYFRVVVSATTIHHVKLEFGNKSTISYDVQPTLAEDTLKCEAYKKVYNHSLLTGVVTSQKEGIIQLPLSTPLLAFPNAETMFPSKTYLANGKVLPGTQTIIPFSISEEKKLMDGSSIMYPFEISPEANLTEADIGPITFFDVSGSINTGLFPTRDEYVFPDDPT